MQIVPVLRFNDDTDLDIELEPGVSVFVLSRRVLGGWQIEVVLAHGERQARILFQQSLPKPIFNGAQVTFASGVDDLVLFLEYKDANIEVNMESLPTSMDVLGGLVRRIMEEPRSSVERDEIAS